MVKKTSFHAASDRFVGILDGSRKLFSNLTDVFSAMASNDFTNDWAPDYAERFFKFNRAQKKFQRDFRDWSNSITEEEWNTFTSLFGWGAGNEKVTSSNSARTASFKQGGDRYRKHSQKAVVSRERKSRQKKRQK